MITYLSSPEGSSINDGIHQQFSNVRYASVDDAMNILIKLGKSAYLAKTDIKSAFRLIPIKPEQHNFWGIELGGKYYFDKCLPMGASSSCHIYKKFSTALEFISKKKGIKNIIHYLDDFLIIENTYDKVYTV